MGRSNAVNFELGPPINTIAPREDDEAKVDEGLGTTGTGRQTLTNREKNEEATNIDVGADAETKVDDEVQDDVVDDDSAEPAPVPSIEDVAPGEEKDKDMEMKDAQPDGPPAWLKPYQDIPYTRFEVFPAVPGGRRERVRPSVSRPTVPRTTSSAPRQKRSSGSHRTSSSRPKSSSKKKTGGTGRGPGRWPKGTKKSDYGNATSGPGLPPGWQDKQAKLQAVTEGNDPDQEVAVEEPAEDSVVVSMRANGIKANNRNAATRKASVADENGEQAVEGEDVDAEGEDI
jgi:histone acetyltransferase SAS3